MTTEPESWLAQYRLDDEDYEPVLDRLSTERRVLGHITDEDHAGRGPRNTLERLTLELSEDPYTRSTGDPEQMQAMLDELEAEGLVEVDQDGVYTLTDAGYTELAN